MFLSRNKKNNVYPCKPQFYYNYKSGSKLYRHVFVMKYLVLRQLWNNCEVCLFTLELTNNQKLSILYFYFSLLYFFHNARKKQHLCILGKKTNKKLTKNEWINNYSDTIQINKLNAKLANEYIIVFHTHINTFLTNVSIKNASLSW